MDRATKLIVVGWAAVAIAAQVWLLKGAWPGVFTVAICAFLAAAALTAFDRRAAGAVLALAYVFPALIHILHGRYHVYFGVLWMAALLGAMVPDGLRTPWKIPAPWRGPVVCWALVVAAGASVVVIREVDFTPALIHSTAIANSAIGGWPKFVISWALHVALIFVLGILWFDWLFGTSPREFFEGVVTPLAVSALAMASVAMYQLFVDFSFLNRNVFGGLGRASGTMFDANVCGMIAALWTGGLVIWAQQLGHARVYAVTLGLLATWLAVWASGSRTAFAAAVVVSVCSVPTLLASRPTPRHLTKRGIGLGAIVLAAVVALLTLSDTAVVGPLERLRGTLPAPTVGSVRDFAVAMWDRNRYGSTAAAMFSDFPLFGVGVGFFHVLVPEYARRISPAAGSLISDNAQNWYRHQLTEFGVIGSLGWTAWAVVFGAFVLARRHVSPEAWIARGMLVGLALVSLVGMPTQHVSVAITFWTVAFWYVSLVGVPPAERLGRRAWAAIAAVVLIYGGGVLHGARNELRVPVRAQRVGWPYSHGFYPLEPDGVHRWAQQRAVAVLPAPTRWLALTVSVDHLGLGERRGGGEAARGGLSRPVDVKVWRNRQLVLEAHVTNTLPVTTYVEVPPADRWVLIETWVSRLVQPADFGISDDRELGLLVAWTFVEAPIPAPERGLVIAPTALQDSGTSR